MTQLANTSVTSESGSNENANAIYSEYDLAYFRDLVNKASAINNAKVMNDINLSNVCSSSNGNWETVGKANNAYRGIFEGNNKTINNVYINNTAESQGIFGYIENTTIKNVILGNGNITGGNKVGGLVGYAKNSNIDNITNNGTKVITTTVYTEDIVYFATDFGRTTETNYRPVNVYALGGIIGKAENTNIKNSTNNVNIGKENGMFVGGIVGCVRGNEEQIIYNCVNNGQMTKSSRMGGIVGEAAGENITIENCTNNAIIESLENIGNSESERIGGICGSFVSKKIVRLQ